MTTPTPSSLAEAREIADKYMLRGGANWSLAIDAIALALDRRGACSSSIEDATNPVCDPDALDRRDATASREMVLLAKLVQVERGYLTVSESESREMNDLHNRILAQSRGEVG